MRFQCGRQLEVEDVRAGGRERRAYRPRTTSSARGDGHSSVYEAASCLMICRSQRRGQLGRESRGEGRREERTSCERDGRRTSCVRPTAGSIFCCSAWERVLSQPASCTARPVPVVASAEIGLAAGARRRYQPPRLRAAGCCALLPTVAARLHTTCCPTALRDGSAGWSLSPHLVRPRPRLPAPRSQPLAGKRQALTHQVEGYNARSGAPEVVVLAQRVELAEARRAKSRRRRQGGSRAGGQRQPLG